MLLMVLNTTFCYGQISKSCKLIDAILSYTPAKEPFIFDRNNQFPIVLIDTVEYFNNCNISNYYNRVVKISHDNSLVQARHPSNYIINVIQVNRKIYRVLLFYRTKGTHSWFTLKWKKNKFVVNKFEEGYL